MSIIRDAAVDGLIVGVGVPILGKANEIARATAKAHGTMFKWDNRIIHDCLSNNLRVTVTIGIVAGIAFSTASWVSRVTSSGQETKNLPGSGR